MGFVPGEEMIDDADVDELEVDDAAVAEAEAEGAGDEPIGVEAHPPSPEVALAAAATTDDDGMVFLDEAPYEQYKPVGSISTWRTNVGMRCFLHTGCSVTRSRRRVTDSQLLQWLCARQVLGVGTLPDVENAAREAHQRLSYKFLSANS